MFSRLSYTWSLMQASLDVLRREKSLVLFPLFSGICCLLVMASFAFPMYFFRPANFGNSGGSVSQQDQIHQIMFYGLVFLFYFTNYFIITFFNAAIASCAISLMSGGQPTFQGGIREAMKRIHLIIGWALVSATVGLVLRLIAERFQKAGPFLSGILGGAWSVVSFLAVPVIVMQDKGPIDALSESTRLLKQTWGQQIAGNFSFGAIFALLGIPAFLLIFAGVGMASSGHGWLLAILPMGLAVVYLVVLSLIHSALNSIFQAAVYVHTQNAFSPDMAGGRGFPVELIQNAMVAKY